MLKPAQASESAGKGLIILIVIHIASASEFRTMLMRVQRFRELATDKKLFGGFMGGNQQPDHSEDIADDLRRINHKD